MSHTPVTPVDNYDNPVSGGGTFQTADNTGTPQKSPLTYTGAATVLNLVVPKRAIYCVLFPSTDLRVSEKADVSQYTIVPAGIKETYPCSNLSNIYLQEDSADGKVRFHFVIA